MPRGSCTGWDWPTSSRGWACVRFPGTSGAGTTGARCCAPRSATRSSRRPAFNKTRFHLPDGPEQEERDALMASGSTDWAVNAVAWIYGHDAAAAT